MITYICAWCGKDMRHVPDDEELISHGMCPACEADVRADAARSSANLKAVKVGPSDLVLMAETMNS